MAARLTQAPLPWLPADAAEIAPGVGLVSCPDGGGVVWVHGLATFCWAAGDEAGRRLAAVQLAELKAATQQQVADAFGTGMVTLWRWLAAYRRDGLAGLLPQRRGPKGPSKLTPELTEKIRKLSGEGRPRWPRSAGCRRSRSAPRWAVSRPAPARSRTLRAPGAGRPGARLGAGRASGAAGCGAPGRRAGAGPVRAARRGRRAGVRARREVPAGRAAARAARPGGNRPGPDRPRRVRAAEERVLRTGDAAGHAGVPGAAARAARRGRHPRPAALGRVLGLDRAPEVKTIRRKLGELAAAGKAADWQMAIARHHADTRPDTLGFLYIDGHTRAYFGERDVQKMHVARLKFPGPATEETWVTDGAGDPLLVVMAEPSSSLAAQIKNLLPDLRAITGDGARPVLCFDRGGWSGDLFASVIAAGFDLLTYRKAAAGKDIPGIPDDQFAAASWTGDDGRAAESDLAESTIELPVTAGEHKGEVLTLRQVTRRDKDRQVHILTTRDAAALPAAAVVYRMTSRWREENYFRYARAHFALDALDTYATTPEDPARLVPNPAKKTAAAAVKAARKTLASAETARRR